MLLPYRPTTVPPHVAEMTTMLIKKRKYKNIPVLIGEKRLPIDAWALNPFRGSFELV